MTTKRRSHGRTAGITRCPGCDKALADGRPVTVLDVEVGTSPRQVMAGHGTTRAQVRWHTECLAEQTARSGAYAAQQRAEWEAEVRAAFAGEHLEPLR